MGSQITTRSTWVSVVLVSVIVGAVGWFATGALSHRAAGRHLTPLPSFDGAPPRVAAAIRDADREARSGSKGAVGALGMVYQANAFDDEARATFAVARQIEPKNPRWPYYTAVSDLTLGRNDTAMEDLEAALRLDPTIAQGWVRLGELRFRSGDEAGAAEAFRKALSLAPTDPHAAVGYGRLLGQSGRWGEAVPLLESAVRAHPNFGPAHRMLALAYDGLGRRADAAKHESMGSQVGLEIRDPLMDELYQRSSRGSVLVMQGKIAETWGDFDRAEKLLRRAAEVAPEDKDVQLAIGRFLANVRAATDPAEAQRARQRLTEARQHIESAMRLDPSYLNVRHDHAIVLEALGDTAGAVRDWQAILEREPDHAMAHMSLGQVAFFRGDYDAAREHYRRGLAVAADTPYTLGERALGYHRLGLACLRAGRTQEALDAFSDATREDGGLTAAWTDWARALKDLGRAEESVALLRSAAAERPADAALALALGNQLLQLERFSEARDALQKAKELAPNDARALAALGYVTLRLGDADTAIRQLQEALAADPRFALAHFHLGNALMQRGGREEAIKHFEEALRINPRLGPARVALEQARGGRS